MYGSIVLTFTQSSSAVSSKRERTQQPAYRKRTLSQLREAALPIPPIDLSKRPIFPPPMPSKKNYLLRLKRNGTHHSGAGEQHFLVYKGLSRPHGSIFSDKINQPSNDVFAAFERCSRGLLDTGMERNRLDIGYTLYFRRRFVRLRKPIWNRWGFWVTKYCTCVCLGSLRVFTMFDGFCSRTVSLL